MQKCLYKLYLSDVGGGFIFGIRNTIGVIKVKMFNDLINIKKRAEPCVKSKFDIKKSFDDKMLAFGWASVAIRADGEVVDDYQNDILDPHELEDAAYKYVEFYGDGGENHQKGGVATIVESIVFTKEKQAALGLANDSLPEAWWIGFHIHDQAVWEKVKDGTYPMFSIEGEAVREQI